MALGVGEGVQSRREDAGEGTREERSPGVGGICPHWFPV